MRHSEAPVAAAKSPRRHGSRRPADGSRQCAPTITTARLRGLRDSRRRVIAQRRPAATARRSACRPAEGEVEIDRIDHVHLGAARTALRMRWCSSGSSWRMLLPSSTMRSACSISASGMPNGSATAPSEKSRLLMRWSRLPVPSAFGQTRQQRALLVRGGRMHQHAEVIAAVGAQDLGRGGQAFVPATSGSRHSPLTFCSGFTARSAAYRPWCE
jgi:hypothetical protein